MEEKKEVNIEEKTKEKVNSILKKAKEKGKITYGELATELGDTNQEQMEKIGLRAKKCVSNMSQQHSAKKLEKILRDIC